MARETARSTEPIRITYERKGAYHIITSEDVFGLMIVTKSAAKALADIAPTRRLLEELNGAAGGGD